MTIDDELAFIEQRDGTLKPEAIVEYASDPETALHRSFDWDDSEAARKYRIWQARQVISVRVRVLPNTNETTRAYVSLPSDRKSGDGYRSIVTVMSDDDLRAELLATAMQDARSFQRKYRGLKELAAVFAAIDEVAESHAGELALV